MEDLHAALDWAEAEGGLSGLINRSEANLAVVQNFVARSDWCGFLCSDEANLSSTSICLKLVHPDVVTMSVDQQAALARQMVAMLADKGVAHDIGAYRSAPAGLRLWGGPTVDAEDMAALMPWLDWAFEQARNQEN